MTGNEEVAEFLLLALVAASVSGFAPAPQAAGEVSINNKKLTADEVAQLTRAVGPVPPGRYWYDSRSGLWGRWGQGAAGRLQPGVPAAPMPADCSNGRTGVFVNGRQITQQELMFLTKLVGSLPPGRYFIDANGGAGREGGPPQVNLFMVARQTQQGLIQKRPSTGGSTIVGGGSVDIWNPNGTHTTWPN